MSPSQLTAFILYLGLLLPFISIGQAAKVDSLKKVLASLPPEGRSFESDTVRVLVLCELGRGKNQSGLFIGNYEECIHLLNEAERIAKNLNWNKGLFLSNIYAGTWHGWKGNSLKALQKKQKAIYYAEIENNPAYLCRAYRYLGDTYYSLKSYQKAIEYYKKALTPAKVSHYGSYLVSMENIGNIYLENGNIKSAKYWLETAHLLAIAYKNQQNLKYITLDLAEVYLAGKDSLNLVKILNEYKQNKFEDKAWDVRFSIIEAKRYLVYNNLKKALLELNLGLINVVSAHSDQQKELYRLLAIVHEKLENDKKALINYKKYTVLHEIDQKEFQRKQIEYLQFEYQNQKQSDQILLLNKNQIQQKQRQNTLLAGIALVILVAGFLVWSNRILSKKNRQIAKQKEELTVLKDEIAESNNQLLVFNNHLESKVKERTAELTNANEKLTRKNQEIQEAFLTGKTQERQRVASELHDNLGSTISGLIWQLEGTMPENLSPSEKKIYENLIQQMRNAYSEVRHISHNLLPLELEKGVMNALHRLITDLNRNSKLIFSLKGEYPEGFLSKSQEAELYSICFEIINNTMKHSQASECVIKLKCTKNQLMITSKDNGKGFDSKNTGKRGRGLTNIEKRVYGLKGNLKIHSVVGKGVSIQIIIPSERAGILSGA